MKTRGFLQRRPSAAEVARLVTRRPTAGEIGNAFPALRRSTLDARRSTERYPTFHETISKGRAHLATSSIRATRSPTKLVTRHSYGRNRVRARARAHASTRWPSSRTHCSIGGCVFSRGERERGGGGDGKKHRNIGRIDESQYDARSSSRDYRTIDPSAQSMQMHIMLLSSA